MAAQQQANGPVIFSGFGRGMHPINQPSTQLWDAHNIRLTAREGESFNSLTNEKSTLNLLNLDKDGYKTYYIGHQVCGIYLILFIHYVKTSGSSFIDTIYRIDLSQDQLSWSPIILYQGTDLGFDPQHPAQIIFDYEANLVQKIYWVDGINRPRLMNIVKPELKGGDYDSDNGYSDVYTDAPFDFVQDMTLDEGCSVVRQNSTSGGLFPAGAIQYVLTYSFKYGQETNPFYTSEILYTSYNDRGGNSEDTINNAFKITVENPETKFDYLNIYSVLRTALNGTPTVKRVVKIDLSNISESTVSYVDTNTTGENVDESYLLFSNRDIVADNIFNKDGTLFLGNLTYLRQNVKDVVGEDVIRSILHNAFTMYRTVAFDYNNQNTNYLYVNQLSQNTSYFRANETYRLGVQFQYKTGEWSEPIWLGDYTVDADAGRPYFTKGSVFTLYLPQIAMNWDSEVDEDYGYLESLIDAGYINIRPVVVLPENYERTVLAQGIVNPTVFQVGARNNNTPHSFASWMFRPMGSDPTIDENVEDKGAVVEWRHLHPLVSGRSSAAEIQNMAIAEDAVLSAPTSSWTSATKYRVLKDYDFWTEITGKDPILYNDDLCVNYFGLDTIKAALDEEIQSVNHIWYVDQSICTLHSPDIEFNSAISSLLDSDPNLSAQVSGLITFNKTLSALDIDLSTVQADPDSIGEKSRTFSSNKGKGLVSFLGFNDGLMDDYKDNGGSIMLSDYSETESTHGSRNWLTYLWHRTGSLNNDCVRPSTDTGTRTAELKTKVISNLRIANYTYWLKNAAALSLAIKDIAIFNSDEISMVKLQDDHNDLGDLIYFGNVDILNPSYTAFKIVQGTGTKIVVTDDEDDEDSDDSSSSSSTVYFVGSVYLQSTKSTSAVPILEEQTIPIAVTSTLLHSNDKITITGTIDQEFINYTTVNYVSKRSTSYTTLYGTTSDLYGQEVTFTFNGSQWEAITVTVGSNVYVFTPSIISYDEAGATYITADNVIADNVLGNNTVEELEYLYIAQDTDWQDDTQITSATLGDHYTAIFAPKDGVRIKYKSTPHGVFNLQYKNYQYDNITTLTHLSMPVLDAVEALDDETNYSDVLATPVTYNDNNITRDKQFWLTTTDSDADFSIVTLNYTFNTTAFVNSYPTDIKSYLWICELMQDDVENRFGGDSYEALLNNTWLPAGPAISLESIMSTNQAKANVLSGSSTGVAYEDGNIWWQWGDTWYQRYDCLKTYPYSTEDVNQLVEIGSFFVETNINIDGRYDRNRGLVDNTNVSPTNFNLINDVYSQKNNFFTYSILDDDYYKTVKYPSQFIWSGVKTPGATNDEWTRTHLAASIDLDGSKGSLTAIASFMDTVIGFQEKAMQRINFNPRALVDAGEGTSGVPIEIAQSLKVDGFNKLYDVGCQDKFSVLTTPNALYFVDHNNYMLYSFDSKNGLLPLSENSGMRYWLKNNHSDMQWMLRADDDYEGDTNGIRIFYDSKYQDVYLTPGAQLSDDDYFYPESLVFSEQLSRFTSLMSYGGSAMFEYNGSQYALAYSLDDDSFNIYEMHSENIDSYNTIFEKVFPFSFSFIYNGDSPGTAKHMENIELRADCYDYSDTDGNATDRIELQGGDFNIAKQDGTPFDFIRVRNEYQDTGIQYFNTLKDGVIALQTPTLRKKFRVWRAQIPRGIEGKNYRGQASRERIYNTWSEITLGKENPGTSLTILHNLNVTGGE